MKRFILILLCCLSSSFAIADKSTIKLCVDMLTKQQPNASVKMTGAQIQTYCNCSIPQIEKIKEPTSDKINKVYKDCLTKTGIKL